MSKPNERTNERRLTFHAFPNRFSCVLCSVHLRSQFRTRKYTELNENIWKLLFSNGIRRLEGIDTNLLASFLLHQALKCLFKRYKCVTFIEHCGLRESKTERCHWFRHENGSRICMISFSFFRLFFPRCAARLSGAQTDVQNKEFLKNFTIN